MTSADAKTISKRQRRAQGSNPSTTWQQQPRIKSAASRARAYVNYAGLNDDDDETKNNDGKRTKKGNTTKKKQVEEMLNPELDLNSPEVKFGRMLGGTEQRVRHKAVKMLRHYLRQRADIATGAGISELDLMKLWKVSVLLNSIVAFHIFIEGKCNSIFFLLSTLHQSSLLHRQCGTLSTWLTKFLFKISSLKF